MAAHWAVHAGPNGGRPHKSPNWLRAHFLLLITAHTARAAEQVTRRRALARREMRAAPAPDAYAPAARTRGTDVLPVAYALKKMKCTGNSPWLIVRVQS